VKYQITLDTKPTRCLNCPLIDRESDGCVLQREETPENISPHNPCIEFENWEKQMENCPIKEVAR
jgi:hypothetical protein